jgi:hypothetical protein
MLECSVIHNAGDLRALDVVATLRCAIDEEVVVTTMRIEVV